MAEDFRTSGSIAAAIDSVRWDYDPDGQLLSPLVSSERYFREFPWEPEEVFLDPPSPSDAPGDGAES